MVEPMDLMHCPHCGDFYEPRTTGSGRYLPHCRVPPYAPHENALSLGQIMEQNALAEGWRPDVTTCVKPDMTVAMLNEYGDCHPAHMDFTAIEARIITNMGLTEDVVDPPLTVLPGIFKMFGLRLWEIILLIALAAFLIWVDATPAHGACILSHCKDASTRTYITNTHRQKVGDLYSVPGQRTQIRDNSRRIIGYVERSGRITNTHRQKKGQLHD